MNGLLQVEEGDSGGYPPGPKICRSSDNNKKINEYFKQPLSQQLQQSIISPSKPDRHSSGSKSPLPNKMLSMVSQVTRDLIFNQTKNWWYLNIWSFELLITNLKTSVLKMVWLFAALILNTLTAIFSWVYRISYFLEHRMYWLFIFHSRLEDGFWQDLFFFADSIPTATTAAAFFFIT